MFDKGLFSISDEFNLLGDVAGKLILKEKHKLNLSNLAYHRLSHGYS
jgi:putative restriction endonuclease